MTWPRDDAKLDRVRALMAEEGLDALVVRAPDNVLYLTNFWGMKGYEAVLFPRQGDDEIRNIGRMEIGKAVAKLVPALKPDQLTHFIANRRSFDHSFLTVSEGK